MNKQIALLRGINVGGKNSIRMAGLKALFESLGLTDVVTYLQSGNVVFNPKAQLNAYTITETIKDQLGLEVPVLIVPGSDFAKVSEQNPYLISGSKKTVHCYVTFLWEKPDKRLLDALVLPERETGSFTVAGHYIYVYCPDGYGRTKINNQFFEKKLRIPSTTRNWKTVEALRDLATTP